MFKFLTLGVLIYLIYRFTVKPSMIDATGKKDRISDDGDYSEGDDGDFVDYEEVE